ncbi:hypothetical protein TNCV_3598981 [Trichonephila clavipes]|nr:hypothetical protein TNCV_3598981 [Trichonephila clavipes]
MVEKEGGAGSAWRSVGWEKDIPEAYRPCPASRGEVDGRISREATMGRTTDASDSLEKAASMDTSRPDMPSTFSEVFSDCKKKQNIWKVPPERIWYPRKRTGGSLLFEGQRGQ